MKVDLLERKATKFVLWRPNQINLGPTLIIGTFLPGVPPTLSGVKEIALKRSAKFPDLYEVDAAQCGLADGVVYHYWFEVSRQRPDQEPALRGSDVPTRRRPRSTGTCSRLGCRPPIRRTTAMPPP